MSVRLGALEARERLVESKASLLVALGGAAVVGVSGVRARASDLSGADRTLLGVTLGVVVPLSCYFAFEAVHRREATGTVVAALARHGADRRQLTLGVLLVLGAVCALTASVDSLVAVLSATSSGTGLMADLQASAWGGALTGAAYTGGLAFVSRWGRAGRLWFLAGDCLLGSGSGVLALPWARGHARNLLGGDPVLALSAATAALMLVAIAAFGVLASARRGPS